MRVLSLRSSSLLSQSYFMHMLAAMRISSYIHVVIINCLQHVYIYIYIIIKHFIDCNVNALELFFVLDSSGSVGSSNYQLMKSFVYDIINSFEVGPTNVQVGVLAYGASYVFEFYFNTYSDKANVLSAIMALPYYDGSSTYTGDALNAVRSYAFTEANGARPASEGIPKVVVVITDGHSHDPSVVVAAATALHNEGYIVFAIGIAGADVNELNVIASDPSYVAFISSFDSDLLSSLQVTISQEACVGKAQKYIY